MNRARIAVVLVSHETRRAVLAALGSLPVRADVEVVVADTGSRDGTVAAVRRQRPDVRVVELANAGFGRAANTGVRLTKAPVIVVANADVRFGPGALDVLAGSLEADPTLGAVGPRVRYPDGTLQASARTVPGPLDAVAHAALGRIRPGNRWTRRYHGTAGDAGRPRDVDWLSGCALALRRRAVTEVGGFDPGFFLYVEDLDLGVRLRAAGWRLRYEPRAEVEHEVAASTSQRRGRALLAHARSIERYVLRGVPCGRRWLLRGLLRPLLVCWVAVTWAAERLRGKRSSATGERLLPPAVAGRPAGRR